MMKHIAVCVASRPLTVLVADLFMRGSRGVADKIMSMIP